MKTPILAIGVLAAITWASPSAAQVACDTIAAEALPQAKVTSAAVVGAGAFAPPGGRGPARGGGPYAGLPAFCRIAVTLTPTPQSSIGAEVWLPSTPPTSTGSLPVRPRR